MLGGNKPDAGTQELFVEIVHREGRTGIDKENAACVVLAQSGLAPFAFLRAPLIQAGALDQAQILQNGGVVLQDVLEMDAGRVQVKDTKARKGLWLARFEGSNGLIGVGVAVIDIAR